MEEWILSSNTYRIPGQFLTNESVTGDANASFPVIGAANCRKTMPEIISRQHGNQPVAQSMLDVPKNLFCVSMIRRPQAPWSPPLRRDS